MAEILLAKPVGETTVIHFGGDNGVNSYTFGQSLLGFTATALAVNRLVNPGEEIEIVIESEGRGSYRSVLRRRSIGGARGFFSEGAKSILWGIIGTMIYENVLKTDPPPVIMIKSDEVIIQHGSRMR